jgi:hypothetical protein
MVNSFAAIFMIPLISGIAQQLTHEITRSCVVDLKVGRVVSLAGLILMESSMKAQKPFRNKTD